MRRSTRGFIPWDDDIDITIPIDQIDEAKKLLREALDFEIQYADNEPFHRLSAASAFLSAVTYRIVSNSPIYSRLIYFSDSVDTGTLKYEQEITFFAKCIHGSLNWEYHDAEVIA